jgi:hypothetical protein
MWIGDVGQDGQEEINFTAASSTGGENYGWRCYEGSAAYNTSGCGASSGYQFPVFTYPNPPAGSAAVTGGIVYRGSTYPALQGYYLAADVYSANVYLIRSNGAGGFITYTQTGLPGSLVGFGETENGEALAVSIVGTVYSISVSSVLPVVLSLFNAQVTAANDVKLLWKTTSEENTHHFEIEYSTTAAAFQPAGSVIASGARDGASYQFTHIINASGRIYYRLKIVDDNGSYRYSNVVAVTINRTKNTFVYPSLITTGVINIYTDQLFQWAQVVNMNGVVVLKKNISGTVGKIEIPVISLSPGTYVVQLYGDVVSSQKIIIQ